LGRWGRRSAGETEFILGVKNEIRNARWGLGSEEELWLETEVIPMAVEEVRVAEGNLGAEEDVLRESGGGRSVGMTEFILGVRNKVAVQQDDLGAVEELRGKLMSAHWT
jgi:hypothetical protein